MHVYLFIYFLMISLTFLKNGSRDTFLFRIHYVTISHINYDFFRSQIEKIVRDPFYGASFYQRKHTNRVNHAHRIHYILHTQSLRFDSGNVIGRSFPQNHINFIIYIRGIILTFL